MKSLRKNTIREILRTPGRFLAILGIIMLGSGFFVGLWVTKDAMIKTADKFLSENAFFDYSLVSTLGLTDDDVSVFSEVPGVLHAEGSISADALASGVESDEDSTAVFISIPEKVNTPALSAGRMPQSDNECLADKWLTNIKLGDRITVSSLNSEDTLDLFSVREFTVCGIVSTPLYLNYERGNTSIGTGSIAGYFYIPLSAFSADYYTEVYLCMDDMPAAYTEEYDNISDSYEPVVTAILESRADIRYNDIITEARDALEEGWDEYNDGVKEYLDAKADAERELDAAWLKLNNAKAEIDDGEKEITDGWTTLERKKKDGERELDEADAAMYDFYKALSSGEDEYAAGLKEFEEGKASLEEGKAMFRESLTSQSEALSDLTDFFSALSETYEDLQAFIAENDNLENLDAFIEENADTLERFGINPEEFKAFLTNYITPRSESLARLGELLSVLPVSGTDIYVLFSDSENLDALESFIEDNGAVLDRYGVNAEDILLLIRTSREISDAEAQLAEAEETLKAARTELDDGWAQYYDGCAALQEGRRELENSVAEAEAELYDAEERLADGKREHEDGLREYYDAKDKADKELYNAEKELDDALKELNDAEIELSELKRPSTYVLGRWSNVGYACFESDTLIVKNISKVFPIFFFLVAALICMTTVTRMVEEQRSQLGVLAALGYSPIRIMSKYLVYAGSATITGSLIGILGGSWLFPSIIWKAYSIMYTFSDTIEFCINPTLSIVTFLTYIAAMLVVTWLSCRKAMAETPANMIRPKPPKAGKRVFLERIPLFWNRLSFTWKVTVRNIFRYRQRVLMMVIGIGGCTALMITGMGIRDSIEDVIDNQYDEITLYDLSVSFLDPLDDEEFFISHLPDYAESVIFYHQESITAKVGKTEKSAYLTVPTGTGNLSDHMDFHCGKKSLTFPGTGEALINSGLAEWLDLKSGDTITVTTDDKRSVTLTVSGVFDNYIYNYIYISEDTYRELFSVDLSVTNASIVTSEGSDDNAAVAALMDLDNVLSVTASSLMRSRMGSLLENLIYIVFLTIFCAAALAFIVIYNLTNINITERMREIATVKVLGFYPTETANYVLRENRVLTVLGIIAGIPMGTWLNSYVMAMVKIDLISFNAHILPISFFYAALMTVVFSLLTELIMTKKISKIDMAGALKSAE